MEILATYRSQHDEILKIGSRIEKLMDQKLLAQNASEIRSALATIAKKIVLHLALEDKSLYPTLLSYSDNKVHEIAENFQKEMNNIAGDFKEYINFWRQDSAIEHDPAGFLTQTENIFSVLKSRIKRVYEELFPLIEDYS